MLCFHCNNGKANAPPCYVTRTWPIFFLSNFTASLFSLSILLSPSISDFHHHSLLLLSGMKASFRILPSLYHFSFKIIFFSVLGAFASYGPRTEVALSDHLYECIYRVELEGGQAGQLPVTPVYKECNKVSGIIGNIMLVKPGYRMRKNFTALTKMFASLILRQKCLKNIGFKGC
jgi:hypothetical protein